MTNKEHTVKREDVTGVWTGFIVVTIVMIALCFFPFQGWQFWMIFPIAGTLIGAVTTTIQFYTAGRKKCSNCGTTLEGDVEFCKVCGVRVITKCPSCNTPIGKNARFCEKCGYTLIQQKASGIAQNPSGSNNINTQNQSNFTGNQQQIQSPKQSTTVSAPLGSYCAACGSKTTGGAKYCLTCGNMLN